MASGQHSAAPSALGYQYQTSWCLFELLSTRLTVLMPPLALSCSMMWHGTKVARPRSSSS